MVISDEVLTDISYVKSSKYRFEVVTSLKGEVKMPKGIANDSGIRTNHVSKVLGDLKKRGLVECINPEARKGRLYRLTEKGESVAYNLDAINWK